MANSWLRLWHDMPTDPKWRVIARASGQPLHLVIALYVALLVDASKGKSRGVTQCHDEDLAVTLDCDMSQIEQIKLAMQGRVLDGNHISGWDTRQPKREDSGDEETGAKSATERKRAERDRKKEANKFNPNNECHDESRNVTTDKDKEEDKELKPIAIVVTNCESSESPKSKPAASQDNCPHQSIVDLYHEKLPELTRVSVWNDQRKTLLRSRWREDATRQTTEWWSEFFGYVAKSDFLMGRTETPGRKTFMADLEWILKPSNLVKIIEGKYHA